MLTVMQSRQKPMHTSETGLPHLAGKRVLILGLARQGLALARSAWAPAHLSR